MTGLLTGLFYMTGLSGRGRDHREELLAHACQHPADLTGLFYMTGLLTGLSDMPSLFDWLIFSDWLIDWLILNGAETAAKISPLRPVSIPRI